MSSPKITIDGVAYVRSRDAARCVGLAPDYVSSLARGGLIDGRRFKNLWFVKVASLRAFMAYQERQRVEWRAHLAKLRRDEQRAAGHPSTLSA